MDWAFDPIAKKEISAFDSKISKYRNYICPGCEAPVQLRRGKKRVYFAHVTGQANPNCEKYMPGTYAEKLLLKTIQQERLSKALGLYIRVVEDKERYSWNLEIGIPEPDRTIGVLKVPFGRQGERLIPINQIKSGGLRIGIIPKETAYKLQVENLFEGDWYNRVTQPIIGLYNYTVFNYSSQGGRRLRQEQSLFWGKAYLILWKNGAEPEWFPKADGLDIKLLYMQDSWTGIFIKLPIEYDLVVNKWVYHWLKRRVEFPPTDVTLITPIPLTRLPDNSLVIEPQSDVLISLVGTTRSKKWNEVCLHSSSENKIIRHRGNGITPYLLSLGRLENGEINIWVDGEFETGIQLIVASQKQKASFGTPCFKFIGYKRDTTEFVSVSFHSPKAMDFIMNWYSRSIILNRIDVPSRLSIDIKWGIAGEKKIHESVLVGNSGNNYSSVGDQLCSLLNDLLLVELTQLIIEAKDYGKVCVHFKTQVDCEIKMSPNWRKRTKWLLVHSLGTRPNIRMVPYCDNQNFKYLCSLDKKLVSKLLISLIPIDFISQYYTIIKELNKTLEDKRGTN
ncbi:hypothetical protein [Gorillibacterium sp. sgz500922]|uniref:competence protein CoiA family protein n=1 Tax=Gorillibacterium sp. sgz500922 TaxID=3446694 RepID=UPI003F675C1C